MAAPERLEVRAAPGGGIAGLMVLGGWSSWSEDPDETDDLWHVWSPDDLLFTVTASDGSSMSFALARSGDELEGRLLDSDWNVPMVETDHLTGGGLDPFRAVAIDRIGRMADWLFGESLGTDALWDSPALDELALAFAAGEVASIRAGGFPGEGTSSAARTDASITAVVDTGSTAAQSAGPSSSDQLDESVKKPEPAGMPLWDPPNFAPIAIPDNYPSIIYNPGAPVELDVMANDIDPDGDDTTISYVSASRLGATVTTDAGDELVLYTPPPGVVFGEITPVIDSFTYRITDTHGAQSNEATVAVVLVMPEPDINTDSNNDGVISAADDPPADPDFETDDPGKIVRYNDDDDNGNLIADRLDAAPFVDGGGNPVFDDDLVEIELDFKSVGVPDLIGCTASLDETLSQPYLRLWATRDKQPLATSYTLGTDPVPDTIYAEGFEPGVAQLDWVLKPPTGPEISRDSVKLTVVKMDIDTDSDNDDDVDRSDFEDTKEDVPGDSMFQVGKRIFVNLDDDNENGKPDTSDSNAVYSATGKDDKNFAEIKFDAAGVSELDGYQLWLGCTSGLNLYSDQEKTELTNSASVPPGTTNDWYSWTIGEGAPLPNEVAGVGKVFVEGESVGDEHVYWFLVKPGGHGYTPADIIAGDTVEINVEEIVYPFATQDYYNWYSLPSTEWIGLAVAEAWHMDKRLVDYIINHSDKGKLETIHPDYDPADPDDGTNWIWSSAEGLDSPTTESYGGGFTMEFDYLFERTRGDGTYGYVRIDNNGARPEKLSFVGNSGVKFGGEEVAILDVEAYVTMAGGLGAFNPPSGYVQSDGQIDTNGAYETEPLNRLMTGVRYAGDYAKMADNPDYPNFGDPDDAGEYYTTLVNNEGRANGHMKIDVTELGGSTYTLSVYLDEESSPCYLENVTLTGFGTLDLQSHWGSGVIFSNMDITKK